MNSFDQVYEILGIEAPNSSADGAPAEAPISEALISAPAEVAPVSVAVVIVPPPVKAARKTSAKAAEPIKPAAKPAPVLTDGYKLQRGDEVTLSDDPEFRGRVEGADPAKPALVLLCVINPGASGHRKIANKWFPLAKLRLLPPAVSMPKSARKSPKAATVSAEKDKAKDTQEMSTKTKAKTGSTAPANGNGKTKTAAKKAAPKVKAERAAKPTVAFADGLKALPALLRDAFKADRLTWADEKFANPRKIEFGKPATAGVFKVNDAAHGWGYTKLADVKFERFWRFHLVNQHGEWVINRTLAYGSEDAAKTGAKREALANGDGKEPQHVTTALSF